MEELKERLYETIAVQFEDADVLAGICPHDHIRLGRMSDGSVRLYYDDCMGPGRIDLDQESARTLLAHLAEALKEEKSRPDNPWPVVYPYPATVTSSMCWCQTCGRWITGEHAHRNYPYIWCSNSSATSLSET